MIDVDSAVNAIVHEELADELCLPRSKGGPQCALPTYRDEKGIGSYRPSWVKRDEEKWCRERCGWGRLLGSTLRTMSEAAADEHRQLAMLALVLLVVVAEHC